jgi:hypothetical protein
MYNSMEDELEEDFLIDAPLEIEDQFFFTENKEFEASRINYVD